MWHSALYYITAISWINWLWTTPHDLMKQVSVVQISHFPFPWGVRAECYCETIPSCSILALYVSVRAD